MISLSCKMNPLNESGSNNFKNTEILSNDIIHILFDNVTIQTRSKGKKVYMM